MIIYKTSEYEILEEMTVYGGSFVKQLALLYRMADASNKKKLEETFRDYFVKYDDMASTRIMKDNGSDRIR